VPLPNFLIIGELKAGTTSLHAYLRQHPAVFMPALKEPRYFSFNPVWHSDQPRSVSPIRTPEEYAALFAGVTHEVAIGEASPSYLPSRYAAERIREVIPTARLIASIRNPVDRVYSSYLMKARAGRASGPFVVSASLVQHGPFANLQHYLAIFPREQLKVLLFDDLVADAAAVVRDVLGFLGVDDAFVPDLRARMVGGVPRSRLLDGAMRAVGRALSTRGIRLPRAVAVTGRAILRANLERPPELDPTVRHELEELFRDDVMRLQDLLRRDLSSWLRT
jgi:hypothetical protein